MKTTIVDIKNNVNFNLNSNSIPWNMKHVYSINFKHHQCLLINKCIHLEQNTITINNCDYNFSFGCLCDRIHTGKSYMLIGLISETIGITINKPKHLTMINDKIFVDISKQIQKKNLLDTTLIIINSINILKWEHILMNITVNETPLNYMLIHCRHQTQNVTASIISNVNIMICTKSIINDKHLSNVINNVVFKRVIYDNVAIKDNITSCFQWYIINEMNNIKNTNVSELVTLDKSILQEIVLKSNVHYSKEEITKRPSEIIVCKTPITVLTLHDLIEECVVNSLNSEDTKNALSILGSKNIMSENNVIKYVLNDIDLTIRLIHNQIHMISKMEYMYCQDKIDRVKALELKLQHYEGKQQTIMNRIKNQSVCHICMEKIGIKTVLKCCSNCFCFECMSKWLFFNKNKEIVHCPLCKTSIVIDDQLIINEYSTDVLQDDNTIAISKDNSKLQNLTLLLTKFKVLNKMKTVIVCDYDNIIQEIKKILTNLDISHNVFKGNYFKQKKILTSLNKNELQALICKTKYISSIHTINSLILFHSIQEIYENEIIQSNDDKLEVYKFVHSNEYNDETVT